MVGSSIGPTFDGRLGIDVSAPGDSVFTTYNPTSYFATFRFNLIQDGGGFYGRANAVSAAAPQVAGIIALMLEANPQLDAAQVKSILQASARTDNFTGAAPNPMWGYGKVNAYHAVLLAMSPTAAPARISGQVTKSDGQPLGGVTIRLDGAQTVTTITDNSGRYSFANIETGNFYTLTPTLANYNFSPSSRSFSLVGDKSDAVFTGNSDTSASANAIDSTEYFIRQQYLDFLDREPDQGGFEYWTNQINQCHGDAACLRQARISVSAAYFMSQEFQDTGSYVYRLYVGALGRQLNYQEFSTDRQQVIGGDNLEAAKAVFADLFVRRSEFMQKYKGATTAEAYVDALIHNVQQSSGAHLAGQRNALIALYNSGSSINESRSLALRELMEDGAFKSAEYNKAFVLMQYFDYLKRDPEQGGYDFWLNVLDSKEPGNYRGMVCSFITNTEYQARFSPFITHSNSECK
jgi:hypothetical protein